MGKIEDVMRSEISRLARKEIRAVCRPLGKDVRELKRTVSRLGRAVEALEKVASDWREYILAEKAKLDAPTDEVESARFSPELIRKLRKRLGLSQAELATVVGVSTVSVGHWERGKNRPAGDNRTALVALRKMGKRDVQKILEFKRAEEGKDGSKKARAKGTAREKTGEKE